MQLLSWRNSIPSKAPAVSTDRKAAIAAYKERKTVAGIYVIRCAASGGAWVGQAPNLARDHPEPHLVHPASGQPPLPQPPGRLERAWRGRPDAQ
jgi:hypothetical protein